MSGEPICIAFFNHKGGIGKTTAVYNIGYLLSTFGKRVLLVDADPQASLTSLIYANLWQSPDEQEKHYSDWDAKQQLGRYCTVPAILHPIIRETEPGLVTMDRADHVDLTPVHNYPNLFLIPGGLETGRLDGPAELGLGMKGLYQGVPKSYSEIFRAIARKHSIDVVLFDLAPSIGAWNRSLIMFSDYLVVPFFADYLSYQAVKSVFQQLKAPWSKQFQEAGMKKPPLFLGAYPQKVRTKVNKQGRTKLVQAYGNWIKKSYDTVDAQLQSLKEQGMLPPKFDSKRAIGIREFQSTGLDVQSSGRPICDTKYPHKHYAEDGVKRNLDAQEKERTVLAKISYMKILGILFSNLTPEHRTQMGAQLMRQLALASTTNEGVDQADIESLSGDDPALAQPHIKRRAKNTYNKKQMNSLLQKYRHEVKSCDIALRESVTLNQLLEENAKLLLEILRCGKNLFIPIDLEKNYWVAVSLTSEKNATGIVVTDVTYYNHMGEEIPPSIQEALKKVSQIKVQTLGQQGKEQREDSGPWVIEYFRFLVSEVDYRFPALDIDSKRGEHLRRLPLSLKNKRRYDSVVLKQILDYFASITGDFGAERPREDLYGLQPYEVSYQPGDCLFEAFAAQKVREDGTAITGREMRARAVEQIRATQELRDQLDALAGTPNNTVRTPAGDKQYESVEEYLELMAQDQTWGTAIELAALGMALRVPIVVLMPNPQEDQIFEGDDFDPAGTVFLRYINRNHYEPLMRPEDTAIEDIYELVKQQQQVRAAGAPGPAAVKRPHDAESPEAREASAPKRQALAASVSVAQVGMFGEQQRRESGVSPVIPGLRHNARQ